MAYSRDQDITRLYSEPIASSRSGPIFNAFSYPTKIDAEAVALFIATHTDPGDTVLDVFGGSGATGIATKLCDRPTDRMHERAARSGLRPRWGPRKAIIYELSPLGALISTVMCDPPDPGEFADAATELVDLAEKDLGWVYAAKSPDGEPGRIRHAVWSEVLVTPCCSARISLWNATVKLGPVAIHKSFSCPSCGTEVAVKKCERAVRSVEDRVTGGRTMQRERVLAQIYGRSGTVAWSRPPSDSDTRLVERIESGPIGNVPSEQIVWGDLYRAGYHTGIERYHHLYTGRNLRAVAALWSAIESRPDHLRDALRLLVLSYNATHSTLLARVVVKRDQPDFVVTGSQTGVLYVSGLPVEKNVLDGVRRKIRIFSDAFSLTAGSRSQVEVVCGSSTSLDLETDSVDYVFTDPPFGDYIPYAEINQVNEAWLGHFTDRTYEVIVSRSQGKGVSEYAQLMQDVFAEVARVLRPSGMATVVFHASKAPIWQALGDAFRENGFGVERTSVLDKLQVSFKQVVSEGGTRGDALFLIRPKQPAQAELTRTGPSVETVVGELLEVAGDDPTELDPQRVYARYVARCVETDAPVVMSAPEFYRWFARRSTQELSGAPAS